MKPKLLVIGLDSLSIEIMRDHVNMGVMPATKKLIKEGVSGHALPEFPIYTPTNWATIFTGAEPGSTCAGDWHRPINGKKVSTFDSTAIGCENMEDAALRANSKILCVQYPGSYPPRNKNSILLAPLDRGLVSAEVAFGDVVEIPLFREGTSYKGDFSIEIERDISKEISSAKAKAVGATEDGATDVKDKTSSGKLHIQFKLKVKKQGNFWKSFNISSKSAKGRIETKCGQWSKFMILSIPFKDKRRDVVVRFKAYSKPVDGQLKLVFSNLYDIENLVVPRQLRSALLKEVGGFFENPVFWKHTNIESPEFDKMLAETIEELEFQVDWIINAAKFMQKKVGWDIFYTHWHFPDSVLHRFLSYYDPYSPVYTEKKARRARAALRECMKLCDKLVKGLAALGDKNTTTLVVSDHGNAPNHYDCNLLRRLVDTGLAVLDKNGKVDKKRSKAYPGLNTAKILLTKKESHSEYEKTQNKVLDALYDWKSSDGKRVVAWALKKKDLPILGYWGPTAGDVQFCYNSGFAWFGKPDISVRKATDSSNHGPQMPTTFTKKTSNMAFFMLKGPKIKKGVQWQEKDKGYVKLIDLVPTLCHTIGIEPPRNVSGAIRWEMLK